MIIQIRGTSGSGKSTVMREVMNDRNWNPIYREGRKKPLCYEAISQDGRRLVVLGHYESPCGGCDTIGSARQVYELIQTFDGETTDVLCEGLLLSEDVKWSSQLSDLRVVFLTTPLARCLAQIAKRREETGNTEPLNPRNTENRVRTIERARKKLVELGVSCFRVSSEQAPGVILSWLRNGD